jgi:hypothetical protein
LTTVFLPPRIGVDQFGDRFSIQNQDALLRPITNKGLFPDLDGTEVLPNPQNAPILAIEGIDKTEKLAFGDIEKDGTLGALSQRAKLNSPPDVVEDFLLVNDADQTTDEGIEIQEFLSRTPTVDSAAVELDSRTRKLRISVGRYDAGEDLFFRSSQEQLNEFDVTCYQYPIYLTWANSLGQWEYWLFSGEHTDDLNFANVGEAAKNLYEDWDANFVSANKENFISRVDAFLGGIIRSGLLDENQKRGVTMVLASIQVERLQGLENVTVLIEKRRARIWRRGEKLVELSLPFRDTFNLPNIAQ